MSSKYKALGKVIWQRDNVMLFYMSIVEWFKQTSSSNIDLCICIVYILKFVNMHNC